MGTILSILTWDLSAVVIAALILGAAGFLVYRQTRSLGSFSDYLGLAGAVICGLVGGLLFIGALTYQVQSSREMASFPRQGQLVDVGGFKINVWCEGEAAAGGPTLVFIPGGYAPGLAAYPLHKQWRSIGRSCLIDRAGTGWSEASASPRTVKNVVQEFDAALSGSDEVGPFVLVGHSLGGLVSANWAARTELEIVGLVTLDPTPLEMISTSGIRQPGGWCYGNSTGSAIQAALSTFGFGHLLPSLHPLNGPDYKEQMAHISEALPTLKAMQSSPREIKLGSDHLSSFCFSGYEVIRASGALGDLPILSIVQSTAVEPQDRETATQWYGVNDDLEWENYTRSMAVAVNEYPAFSTRGKLVGLPDRSWGHNFPSTHPGYVIDQLQAFLASLESWPIDENEQPMRTSEELEPRSPDPIEDKQVP